MKRIAALALIGGIGIGAASAALAGPAAASLSEAVRDPLFAAAHWDDDDDDYRANRAGAAAAMPVPDAAAIRRAGIVRVKEVERDDGRIEIEGYDAQGREIELVMDASGRRVLRTERDDRWDD